MNDSPAVLAFVGVFATLALLPLFDVVALEVAFYVAGLVPRSVPGGTILGRQWFWVVVATVAVGVGYRLLRGMRLQRSLPRTAPGPTLAFAVGGPLLCYGILVGIVHATTNTSVTAIAHLAYAPVVSAGFIWWNAVLPGLLIGLAYGVLFFGAIQAHLRERLEPVEAVLAVTLVAGGYHWLVDPIVVSARSNLLRLIPLALVVGTGFAGVALWRMRGATTLSAALSPARILAVGLAAILTFGLAVDVISGTITAGELLLAAAWFGVLGVAAAGFERTRSTLIPAVAVALFQVSLLVTPAIEAGLGIATLP